MPMNPGNRNSNYVAKVQESTISPTSKLPATIKWSINKVMRILFAINDRDWAMSREKRQHILEIENPIKRPRWKRHRYNFACQPRNRQFRHLIDPLEKKLPLIPSRESVVSADGTIY